MNLDGSMAKKQFITVKMMILSRYQFQLALPIVHHRSRPSINVLEVKNGNGTVIER
jgi:hypothetical protein